MSASVATTPPPPMRTANARRPLHTSRWLRFALPIALLAAWQAASTAGFVAEYLLPAPTTVLQSFLTLVRSGELVRDVAISGLRVLEGFALAAVVGLSLGTLMGLSKSAYVATDSLLQILKPIPPIAFIPLAILWLGLGELAKVSIIFVGAVFPILFNTLDAIRQTDGRFVDLARTLELPRRQFILQILLPGAVPQIMTGLRVGITIGWMCVVAAELIAANSGVGYLIMQGRALAQSDVVIVGMLVTGALGKITDDLLRLLESRLVRWRTSFMGL